MSDAYSELCQTFKIEHISKFLGQFPPGQLPLGQFVGELPPRAIDPPDNCSPPKQFPHRTIITPGQLLLREMTMTNYNFFFAIFCFFPMVLMTAKIIIILVIKHGA